MTLALRARPWSITTPAGGRSFGQSAGGPAFGQATELATGLTTDTAPASGVAKAALVLSMVSTLSIATLASLALISHVRGGEKTLVGCEHGLGAGDRGRYCVVAENGNTASCSDDIRQAMDLKRCLMGSHILDRKSGVRFAGARTKG